MNRKNVRKRFKSYLVSLNKDLMERYKIKQESKCSKMIQKAPKFFQQQQSKSLMKTDNLYFFKFIRTMQIPSLCHTHTVPERSRLKEFFKSIGSRLVAKVKDSSEPVLSRICKKSLVLFPTTTAETFNICLNLKNLNSEGKDGIANNFVKFFSPNTSET